MGEAVAFGLLAGCVTGSAFGAASLILNKSHCEWVNVLALIPVVILAIYIFSLVSYWIF